VTFEPAEKAREWFGSHAAASSPAVAERFAIAQRFSAEFLDSVRVRLERSPDDECRSLCREITDRLPRQLPVIAAELKVLRPISYRLQPCLRDIWHDHVLFTNDRVTGMIDPSACRGENVAADLARLIGSLVEDDPRLRSMALEAYQSCCPLDAAELNLVAALDRSGVILSAATWLEWLYLSDRKFEDRNAMLSRLRHWQRRVSRL
jgi:Ser/Thr protein kinase RdoA (MazF antagonist)